jgi:hypothetical protein
MAGKNAVELRVNVLTALCMTAAWIVNALACVCVCVCVCVGGGSWSLPEGTVCSNHM